MLEEPQVILTGVKAVDTSGSVNGGISGAVTDDGCLCLWMTAHGGELIVNTME